MRSMFRTLFAALLAVLAVGAVASASASAACSKEAPEEWNLCIGGTEATANTPFVAEEQAGNVVVLSRSGDWTIECERVRAKGEFEIGADSANVSVSDLEIKYTKCKESRQPSKCSVEPIVVGAKDGAEGVVVGAAPNPELTIEASEGTTLTTIKINEIAGQGGCLQAGSYVVKGKQTCELGGLPGDESAEEEAYIHDLVCTSSGSALTIGGKAGTYSGTSDVIAGVKQWAIVRS